MYQTWIILLQCMASMAVINNELFASSTQEKCTLNLNSLLFQMSHELDNLTQDTISMETREADAQLNQTACSEHVTWSPWQVCFDSVKCLNFMLPKLLAVTCDSRRCSGSVHISLESVKQTIGYWLSLTQYIGLILYPNLVYSFVYRNLFGDLFKFD